MSSIKTRPSRFPYAVMLAIMPIHLLFGGIILSQLSGAPGAEDDSAVLAHFISASLWLVALMYAAACSLACAQWFIERRQIAGLQARAVALIGLIYFLLAAALNVSMAALSRHVTSDLNTAYQKLAFTLLALIKLTIGRTLTVVFVVFALWLAFRLFRQRAVPPMPFVEYRWRALVIFTSLLWTWALTIVSLGAPSLLAMNSLYATTSPGWLLLGLYAGTIGLVLPGFLGALLGLPRNMRSARVLRLLLTSVLALLVCVLTLGGIAYGLLCLGNTFDDFKPGLLFVSCTTLVWGVLSTTLCWLLFRGLLRQRSSPSLADGAA